jgi:DNA-binding protein HU-beta
MNKNKLTALMSTQLKSTKTECKEYIDAFIAAVKKSLKKNGSVCLTGFGTLRVVKRKSRKGVNPSTKMKMTIPAKSVVKFKASQHLRSLIN